MRVGKQTRSKFSDLSNPQQKMLTSVHINSHTGLNQKHTMEGKAEGPWQRADSDGTPHCELWKPNPGPLYLLSKMRWTLCPWKKQSVSCSFPRLYIAGGWVQVCPYQMECQQKPWRMDSVGGLLAYVCNLCLGRRWQSNRYHCARISIWLAAGKAFHRDMGPMLEFQPALLPNYYLNELVAGEFYLVPVIWWVMSATEKQGKLLSSKF